MTELPDSTEADVDLEAAQAENPLRKITPFTLIGAAELRILQMVMEENSSLSRKQMAMNSWGFPIIPIPEIRGDSGGRLRLAPTNVSDSYIGHPIYWIDPELTKFDSRNESEESWSIRMFYLILGMGYWTEDLKWYSFLDVNDLPQTRMDIDRYHISGNPHTPYDEVPLLSKDDLKVTPEDVDEAHILALDTCSKMLSAQAQDYQETQRKALKGAVAILGTNFRSHECDIESPNGLWLKGVWPVLSNINDEYARRVPESGEFLPLSDLFDPAIDAFKSFQEILTKMDSITALLSVPVIRNAEVNSVAFAQVSSYLALATSQAEYRRERYKFTDRVAAAFSSNREYGAMLKLVKESFNTYSNCWHRLRLATLNYHQLVHGESAFSSYEEAMTYLVENAYQNDTELNLDEIKMLD